MRTILEKAALRMVEAQERHRIVVNGLGHPGQDHDTELHDPPPAGSDFDVWSDSLDCAACAGQRYGCDIDINLATGELRAAIGLKRRPWEVE